MTTSYDSRLGTSPEEAVKAPCVGVSLTNITLSGEQTIGTIAAVAGDRWLVGGQTDSPENGIYDVSASSWTRSTDWNDAQDVVNGQLMSIPNAVYQATFVGDFNPGVTSVVITDSTGFATNNRTNHEFGSSAAASSHPSIIVGHIIETSYFDTNRINGSGARHRFTGVTITGNAGVWSNADGYFYDADGKQFAVMGLPVNVLWFGARPDDGTIDDRTNCLAAVVYASAIGAGVVYFPTGSYRSPFVGLSSSFNYDGVTLQGAGRPEYNSTFTQLVGGTILQGPLHCSGNGNQIRDLGVDVGSVVCDAFFSGTSQEGVLSSTGVVGQILTDNLLSNVSVLCVAAAAVHALLFEQQQRGTLTNIQTVYANSGIVIKGSTINADNLYCRSHGNYCLLLKSDALGSITHDVNINNVILDSVLDESLLVPNVGANWDSEGLDFVSTTGHPVYNVNISNLISRNTKSGIKFTATSGEYIAGINITNFTTDNHFFAGINVGSTGVNRNLRLSNGITSNSGYGVLVQGSLADDIRFCNVTSKSSIRDCFSSVGTNVVFDSCTAQAPGAAHSAYEIAGGKADIIDPKFIGAMTELVVSGGTANMSKSVNVGTSKAITEYLRMDLVSKIEGVTGAASVVAAWFSPEVGESAMRDYSSFGTHAATVRDGTALTTKTLAGDSVSGISTLANLDANTVFDTPDAADLSFGDGSTDSAFSVVSVADIGVTSTQVLLAKMDLTTGSEQREWALQPSSSSGLFFYLNDNSTGGLLGRRLSGSIAAYTGLRTWSGTYDGSSTTAGLKVYIDGAEVTNSNISSGSYTAMENTTAKVATYSVTAAGATGSELTGDVGLSLVFNVELSASHMATVHALLKAFFNY